jgi:hypothetical protein
MRIKVSFLCRVFLRRAHPVGGLRNPNSRKKPIDSKSFAIEKLRLLGIESRELLRTRNGLNFGGHKSKFSQIWLGGGHPHRVEFAPLPFALATSESLEPFPSIWRGI